MKAVEFPSKGLEAEDELGGSREGVVSVRHGRRARVIRNTLEVTRVLPPSVDRGDHGGGQALFPQARALLDMHFKEALVAAEGKAETPFAHRVQRDAGILSGGLDTSSGAILQFFDLFYIYRSRPGTAAQHGDAEGGALFLGEDHELQNGAGPGPQKLEGDHHADYPVEFSPARHRIDMGAAEPGGLVPGEP